MGRTPKGSPAFTEFGNRLRKNRLKQGLSQEELGVVSGMHFTYIGSVERGERNVSLRTILRLAEALDIDPARLVKGLKN